MPQAKPWSVYFLECEGGSLYIGISNDVEARFAKHCSGRGARYTRMHPPLRIVATEVFASHSAAASAEHQLKQLNRKQKLAHIAAINAATETPPASS